MQNVANLTVDEVKEGLDQGSILLVDVREENEWVAGHIPGSILLPLSVLDPTALPPLNGRRLVLSCRSGKRSLTAAAQLQDAGLPAHAHLAGGFLDWSGQGCPVETGL
ncbi:MAG: rhodanese-like domain-containing protein [Beijerinckiaceae bacterium]|nr:rhodanese-like domain-containing protein [Beijerinckiaceae bacterium]